MERSQDITCHQRRSKSCQHPDYLNRALLAIAPHDHLQSAIDAPTILIEYGDYQCPYIAEVHKMIKTIQHRLNHQREQREKVRSSSNELS
ncbi:MAG: hypothetical protein V7L00_18120 [Nostoc sp.]|uniref:hypothetical protein n=1 Tax=Nostoc sp. TaxID=1180 RepID=UPI002FF58C6F